jgi:hypothetical protein
MVTGLVQVERNRTKQLQFFRRMAIAAIDLDCVEKNVIIFKKNYNIANLS